MKLHIIIVSLALAAIGANANEDDMGANIIKGQSVLVKKPSFDYSFLVSMQNGGRHFCGGSLISPTRIVTAAHCVKSNNKPGRVVIGAPDLRKVDDDRNVFFVKSVERLAYTDAAIMELVKPVPADIATPIALPSVNEPILYPKTATVLGWGSTKYGTGVGSDVLMYAVTPIRTHEECVLAYGSRIRDNNICAGGNGRNNNRPDEVTDSCQGDSGGPLVVFSDDGGVKLRGIVSFGDRCGVHGRYGVYEDVSSASIAAFIKPRPTTEPTFNCGTIRNRKGCLKKKEVCAWHETSKKCVGLDKAIVTKAPTPEPTPPPATNCPILRKRKDCLKKKRDCVWQANQCIQKDN